MHKSICVLALAAGLSLVAHEGRAAGTLAFEKDDSVFVAAADGTGAHKLVAGYAPCIAPDGKTVAFTQSFGKEGRRIALVDIASTKVTVVPGITGDNSFGPVYSPDGKRLLFNFFHDGNWAIALVGIDGAGFRIVKQADEKHPCYAPAWASDSASYFCHDFEHVFRFDLDGKQLWTGPSLADVQGSQDSASRLAASPDGKSLLLELEMGGKGEEVAGITEWDDAPLAVWLIDLPGGTLHRVTPQGSYGWQATWGAADEVVFTCQHKGEKDSSLCAIPAGGGKEKVLVRGARSASVSR